MATDNSSDFLSGLMDVVPSHYTLEIIPNIDESTFAGHETIKISLIKKTKSIIFHSFDINISSASLVIRDREFSPEKIDVNRERQIAVLAFSEVIEPGSGHLKLAFNGMINEHPTGVFRYKPDGRSYVLACRFEPNHARQAFPCWDESTIKSKFELTLVAPKDLVALSNTLVVEESEDALDKSKKVHRFATTPSMSTYLLFFVIGEYDYVEATSNRGIPIRVYTPMDKADRGEFALKVATRCTSYFEDLYDFDYPVPKIDLIPIPGVLTRDFERLENDSTILVHSEDSCEGRITYLVCREIVRKLFGNLVAIDEKKEAEFKLREGFIALLLQFPAKQLFPELKDICEMFVIESFSLEISLESDPIGLMIPNPETVSDELKYRKGAGLIRVLYDYLGDDDFQRGMHDYLSQSAYKNAVTEDLWHSLERASKKPVRSIMSTWTRQKGYPVIDVTARQDGSNRVLTLTPENFTVDREPSEKDPQIKWLVPIILISQGTQKPVKVLLGNRSQEVIMERVEPHEWVKLDTGMPSLYRIKYSTEMLELFQPAIVVRSLSIVDRLQMHTDLNWLMINRKARVDIVLKFMLVFKSESEVVIWRSLISTLKCLRKVIDDSRLYKSFNVYIQELLSEIRKKVKDAPIMERMFDQWSLQDEVFDLLVSCRDPEAIRHTIDLFKSSVKRPPVPPALDIRKDWINLNVEYDHTDFMAYIELYKEKPNFVMAVALCSVETAGWINDVIPFVRAADTSELSIQLFKRISSHPEGRIKVWQHFKSNFEHFIDLGEFPTDRLLKNLIESFSNSDYVSKIKLFFDHPTIQPRISTEIKQTLKSAFETVKRNREWIGEMSGSLDKLTKKPPNPILSFR